MTTHKSVRIMCSECGQEFITTVAPSICTWLDADLVQHIYDNGYTVQCEHCSGWEALHFKGLINAPSGMFTLDFSAGLDYIRKSFEKAKIIDAEGKVLSMFEQAKLIKKSKGSKDSPASPDSSETLHDKLRRILG